jgi:hypothetical protein
MKRNALKFLGLIPLLVFLASCSKSSTSTSNNTSSNNNSTTTTTLTSVNQPDEVTDLIDTTNYDSTVSALTFTESTTGIDSATSVNAGDEITAAGSYKVSGTQSGTLTVSATGDVHLYLDGVTWTGKKKVIDIASTVTKMIITVSGTNTISNSTADKNVIASDSTGDLVINGTGTLSITATKSCIKTEGTLKVIETALNFYSTGNALNASTIQAKDATIYAESGKDVFHAELADSVTAFTLTAGYVYLNDVTLTTGSTNKVYGDIVQADTYIYILSGSLEGTTTGVFVTDTTDNRSTYDLEDDDFRYIYKNNKYQKIASDYMGSETKYALAQSCKGLKAGEIEYDTDGDDVDDGIASSTDYLIEVKNATINFNCTDDALHSNNGDTNIESSTLTLATYDDASTVHHMQVITDSTLNITSSYEGLEAEQLFIDGENTNISIVSSDDGINASTDYDATNMFIEINAGSIYVNASGDGIDSNGYLRINGGTIFVEGPTDAGNSALDTESGIYINGGTLLATGSTGMLELPSTESKQPSIVYAPTSSVASGTVVSLVDSSNNTIISKTLSKSAASFIVSDFSFALNSSYTLKSGSTTLSTITLSSTVTNDGNLGGNNPGSGGGNPGGGNPGGGGRP